jgi:pimeloyl-ACP methyl ester carboxylesterase
MSGEGKALILLHGWPGFWKDWERVVEPLSSSAMLVLPDLRGFGLSDKPESVEEYAPSPSYTIPCDPSARRIEVVVLDIREDGPRKSEVFLEGLHVGRVLQERLVLGSVWKKPGPVA